MATSTPSLKELLAADWEFQQSDNPCFASQSGNHAYDDKLQDISPAAFTARLERNRELLEAMAEATADAELADDTVNINVEPMPSAVRQSGTGGGGRSDGKGGAAASGLSRADFAMLRQSIADETRALELGCHLFPVNSIGYGGVHYNFIEALDWIGGSDGDGDGDGTGERTRDENLVARMEAFPAQCRQYKELLLEGVRRDRVASKAMIRKVPEQLRAATQPPLLVKMVGAIDAAAHPELRARADAALAKFGECIEDLVRFFEDEYAQHAREKSGCSGMSDEVGSQMYALCLRFHTTTYVSLPFPLSRSPFVSCGVCDCLHQLFSRHSISQNIPSYAMARRRTMTPNEVHTLGRAEVARIEARYQNDVLKPLGFKGSFADFVAECQDPSSGHYYTDPDELLQGYRDLCDDIRKELPRFFDEFPESPLEVVAKDAASAPAAYYMQGTADGKRPGRFYVNVSNMAARPKYAMTALALHEGIPGHHHQNALAIENPSIPPFRRFIEDRRYEYCPARRQLYAAYLEGWALYCEHLGEEMGAYKTPYDLFGRLSMEMMRAVRLVRCAA